MPLKGTASTQNLKIRERLIAFLPMIDIHECLWLCEGLNVECTSQRLLDGIKRNVPKSTWKNEAFRIFARSQSKDRIWFYFVRVQKALLNTVLIILNNEKGNKVKLNILIYADKNAFIQFRD